MVSVFVIFECHRFLFNLKCLRERLKIEISVLFELRLLLISSFPLVSEWFDIFFLLFPLKANILITTSLYQITTAISFDDFQHQQKPICRTWISKKELRSARCWIFTLQKKKMEWKKLKSIVQRSITTTELFLKKLF